MRRMALLLAVLLSAGLASAHSAHFEEGGDITYENSTAAEVIDNPETFVSTYNSNADELPSLIKSLVSGERVNVHIDAADGEKILGANMDGAHVERVEVGGVDDPTVEFFTDAATLEVVATAENPRDEAISAFSGPHITYEAHGLGSKIKFAVVSALVKVFGSLL